MNVKQYDIAIVGGGVMGLMAAWFLQKSRKEIVLIDKNTIINRRNASNDVSKSFRVHYGDNFFYTELALKSLVLWKRLERELGHQFYYPCGKLLLAKDEESYAFTSYSQLKNAGLKVSLYPNGSVSERFPQFTANIGVVDELGGLLDANALVQALYTKLKKAQNVTLLEEQEVTAIEKDAVQVGNDKEIRAEKVLLTAGAWTYKLLNVPMRATRQQVLFFQPEQPLDYTKNRFPIFSYMEKGFYGLPMQGINAVKFSNHHAGGITDPDDDHDYISKECKNAARQFFREFIPSLADAPIIKQKICYYAMTGDRNFIIDEKDGILVGTGFSGHGFKFAPLIGRTLSDLVLGNNLSFDLSLFKLDGKMGYNGEQVIEKDRIGSLARVVL